MTLLFSGCRHKNHMTTHVMALFSGCGHKNHMITRVITSLTTSVSTMRFLVEIMLTLKAIKSHLKRSYDEQNLTRVVISDEIYETRQRLVS